MRSATDSKRLLKCWLLISELLQYYGAGLLVLGAELSVTSTFSLLLIADLSLSLFLTAQRQRTPFLISTRG